MKKDELNFDDLDKVSGGVTSGGNDKKLLYYVPRSHEFKYNGSRYYRDPSGWWYRDIKHWFDEKLRPQLVVTKKVVDQNPGISFGEKYFKNTPKKDRYGDGYEVIG